MVLNLNTLLEQCDAHVRTELDSKPEVEDVVGFDPDKDVPPITARRWYRIPDAVAVVADLKNSTQLGLHKHAASTASIYEAALRPVVDVFRTFGAGWIPIQGDCVIGIFWDDTALERAICAGITVKTFSKKHFVERVNKKWDADTGFKVGIAGSTLLLKRIGLPNTPHQAHVWPGKAVNHAVKAAQSADAHELVVTGSIWDELCDNDYLTFSCECGTPSPSIWRDHAIEKLAHDDVDRTGRCLTSMWCNTCGEHFCNQILAGETRRESADQFRGALRASMFQDALAAKNQKARQQRRGLREVGAR